MSTKEQICAQLGGREAAYLDSLAEPELVQLAAVIENAKKHEQVMLHDAINHALNVAPRLLRGSMRRILFPND